MTEGPMIPGKTNEGSTLRWILFSLCAIFLLILYFLPFYFLRYEGSIPFSLSYHSWVEKPLLGMLFFLSVVAFFSVFIMQFKSTVATRRVGNFYFLISLVGMVLTVIYHFNYSDRPTVPDFKSYAVVIPFHVQLSLLFFMGMAIINFVMLFAKPVKLWVRILSLIIVIIPLIIIQPR